MAKRTTFDGAERMLRQHALAKDQAWRQGIMAGLVKAKARAGTFWMPQASMSAAPRSDKLSRRTGATARSIRVVPPRDVGNDLVFGLTAGGADAPGARIHEFGGVTRPHIIRAVNAKALRWLTSTGPRFARFVNHPGSRIPARPYLRPATQEQVRFMVAEFRRLLRAASARIFGQ